MEDQDRQRDKEAIMQVIAGEGAAFWNKDYHDWARYWEHSEKVRLMGWWAAGWVTVMEGWTAISASMQKLMAANPTPNPTASNVQREKINIQVGQDIAWVTFDQYGNDTGDARMDMPGLSRETRILERNDGEWRLVYVCLLLEGEAKSTAEL